MENNRTEKEKEKAQGKEINFQWFIVSFLIHWKWFVLSVIFFLSMGYIYLRYVTPVYNVSSKIVLKDSKRGGMSNSELSIFQRMGYLESSSNVENEIEIIRSRDLLETVVIEEESFIRYSVKGRFRDTDLYGGMGRRYYAAPPIKVFLDKSVISSLYSTISLKLTLTDKSSVVVVGQYGSARFENEFQSIPAVLKTPIGEVLLLPDDNNVTLKKEYPLYIQIIPPLWIAQSYMGALGEELLGKDATVVHVSLRETNPKRGESFLTRLFQVYNRETMLDKNKAANSASAFIEKSLNEISKDLVLSEDDVEAYKTENKIGLEMGTDAGIIAGENNNYFKKIISLGSDELKLSYLESFVENNKDNKDVLPAAVLDNPQINETIMKYNQRLMERDRLLNYTKEDAPIILKTNERLSLMRESILASIRSLKYSYGVTRNEYEGMIDNYDSGKGDLPRKERELSDLDRQQMIKSNLYVDLLRRKQEIDFTLAVTAPSAKVIESPLTGGLVSPRKTMIYFMCLVCGLLFPFIVIGIRELMNYKLSHEEEVRRLVDIPIIVSLPIVKTKSSIVVTSHATTAIVERFRLLRTNLQFILDSPEKKSILVTSTISGE